VPPPPGAGHFKLLSNNKSVPLVAFSLTKLLGKDGRLHSRVYDEFDLADRLKQNGWILPAYTMAPDARWGFDSPSCVTSLRSACSPACQRLFRGTSSWTEREWCDPLLVGPPLRW
jgi:hypothetical protein